MSDLNKEGDDWKMTDRRKTILIADDEETIRLSLRRHLSDKYIVLEASDGEEVMNIARGQKLDLIIIDIMMPKKDGYTVCYEIKNAQATETIPVVILSALGYPLDKEFGKQMGADAYITKPFDSQDLHDTIRGF